MTYQSFLGTGWSFPPTFHADSGEVAMTVDEADIAASLQILFGTIRGERFLNPKYGLNLRELLFEPLSTTMTTFIKDNIRTNILIYEPRITVLALELNTARQNEGRIEVLLEYSVRATNSRYNLVYPFYISDGSEAKLPVPPLL
ncbi:GPW/gp25 family protein [Permianibacter sp. IMCC34836]|uniref:GPW/gp25 family protein n=1 Tax=Permianibacter fluminis TaxID=2738515 RepID=UPI001556EA7F|nr:GPW/gp25 family protein [Permianibacter fluminis]NQD38311.1 GPW/gp25 family protein [Permianibacter fluminis]